jgi:hypothetical protein
MTVLVRALGLQAAYAVLQAMSPAAARVASVALLLTVNAVPLVALLNGEWGAGDVLIAYWLENVAVGVWSLVKTLTVTGTDGSGRLDVVVNGVPVPVPAVAARALAAGFFALHYGMFTLGHGLFAFTLARRTEVTGSVAGFALMFLALLASHGLSTGIHWFARGERLGAGLGSTMRQPYSRVVVLHLAVLGSAFLLLRGSGDGLSSIWPAATTLGPGLVLVAIKVVVDVVTHLQVHRGVAAPVPDVAAVR